MSKSRGGLGRGLAALIPTGPATSTVSDILMGGLTRPTTAEAVTEPVADRAPSVGTIAGTAADGDTGTARETPVDGGMPAGSGPATGDGTASSGAPEGDSGPRYAEIPVSSIRPNPRNPRTVFDQDALDELAHSIREFGLLQPVVVRPTDDGYELVMGERRWRAAQQAGVSTVSAIVRRTEDADLLRDALLENIHRTNLNPLEEAAAYQQLLEEFEVTQDELASRLGRSRPVISNTIRLLNLPIVVQRRVAAGVLSAGHARALLSLSDAGDQEELASRIVAEGLSVRGAEEAVTLLARHKPTVRRTQTRKMIMPGVQELAANLSDAFDTRVLVELGRRKGKIVVEFATVDDLERLVGIIAPTVARRQRGSGPGPAGGATRPPVPAEPTVPSRPIAAIAPGVAPLPAATGLPTVPSRPQETNPTARPADLYEVTAGGFVTPVEQPATPTGPDAPRVDTGRVDPADSGPLGSTGLSSTPASDSEAADSRATGPSDTEDLPSGADRGSDDRESGAP
jgi:ParB family chromosome partitioning protein